MKTLIADKLKNKFLYYRKFNKFISCNTIKVISHWCPQVAEMMGYLLKVL